MPPSLPIRIELPTPFIVGPVNVFLLPGPPVTLIDCGTRTEESVQALAAALRAHGLELSDLERIYVTHHHVDHVGALRQLMDASGAEAYGHPHLIRQAHASQDRDEAQRQFFLDIMHEFGVPECIQTQSMALWDNFRGYGEPFTLTGAYEDGELCGPFRTWFVPGHSATDTLLVDEANGYTIVGDHILETFNPNPLLRRPPPGEPREKSLVQYQASLRRSRELDLGACLPGHGKPIADHRKVIDGILAQHERRNNRLLRMISEAGITVFEVAQRLFPKLEMQHLYLGLSVAVGHLELLESRELLVSSEDASGVTRYHLSESST